MYNEAIAEFHKAINLSGPEDKRGLVALSWVYAQMGKRGEAMRLLDELKESSKQGYFSPYDVAVVYTALGEKDQAFEWLQQAYEERSGALTHLKVDPRFDSLRLDPRFQDLLRRVGLAP
jgi:tetratricopeptide (TPR) repeat protein